MDESLQTDDRIFGVPLDANPPTDMSFRDRTNQIRAPVNDLFNLKRSDEQAPGLWQQHDMFQPENHRQPTDYASIDIPTTSHMVSPSSHEQLTNGQLDNKHQQDTSPWIQKSHGDAIYGNEVERYVKMHKLGEGTYGAVYQCRDRNTGETVALKKMRILEDIEEGISASTIREISILYELCHPNVVTLHDVLFCESRLCLVFEFLEMDLKRYMNEFPLSIDLVKSIVFQILSGLAHCHSRRVLHRDIKPHNILISPSSLTVKLADFGLARAMCTQASCYTQEVVTQWYRSPEVLLGVADYSPAVDVWSAGCIMAELLNGGEPFFPGDCEIDQIFKIFQMLGTPSCDDWGDFERCKYFCKHFPVWKGDQFYLRFPELDSDGFNLLSSMFTYDPKKRISAAQALQHPWFAS